MELVNQTCQAGSYKARLRAIRVADAEGRKMHVLEEGKLLMRGILRVCEFLSWRHQNAQTGAHWQVHHNTTKSWHWVHIASAGHVHPICTSFQFLKLGQIVQTRLKVHELIALVDGHVPLWLRVLNGTSSTCQKGKLYTRGVLRVCEILELETPNSTHWCSWTEVS